jgi:hypothetical protein
MAELVPMAEPVLALGPVLASVAELALVPMAGAMLGPVLVPMVGPIAELALVLHG